MAPPTYLHYAPPQTAPPTMDASDDVEKAVSSINGLVAGGGTAKGAVGLSLGRRGIHALQWKQAVVVVHLRGNTLGDTRGAG